MHTSDVTFTIQLLFPFNPRIYSGMNCRQQSNVQTLSLEINKLSLAEPRLYLLDLTRPLELYCLSFELLYIPPA